MPDLSIRSTLAAETAIYCDSVDNSALPAGSDPLADDAAGPATGSIRVIMSNPTSDSADLSIVTTCPDDMSTIPHEIDTTR